EFRRVLFRSTEPLQGRMARRSVFAVIVEACGDAERSQRRGVERDRTLDVANREKNVIQHVRPLVRQGWAGLRDLIALGKYYYRKTIDPYRDCPGRRSRIEPGYSLRGSFDRVV